MKRYLLDQIESYLPSLRSNNPILTPSGQLLTEFSFTYENIAIEYKTTLDKNTMKHANKINTLKSNFHDSKLFEYTADQNPNRNLEKLKISEIEEKNKNFDLSNNLDKTKHIEISAKLKNIDISNNIERVADTSASNFKKPESSTKLEKSENLNKSEMNNKLENIGKFEKSDNNFNKSDQKIENPHANEFDNFNDIPIRPDFSSDDEDELKEEDKLFLGTFTKDKKDFTKENWDFLDSIKLSDEEVNDFINGLGENELFEGGLNLSEHNLTDQTSIKLAKILQTDKIKITDLNLAKNMKMGELTGVFLGEALKSNTHLKCLSLNEIALKTIGANRLIESIRHNKTIEEIDFGLLTDSSLGVLNKFLNEPHNLRNLGFGQDENEKWRESTKQEFIHVLQQNKANRRLHSINVYVNDMPAVQNLLGNIALITVRNRQEFLKEMNNRHLMNALEASKPEYFEENNNVANAKKFSCKTYIANVFSTVLDEGLYYLEKERMNKLRDEKIAMVKKEEKSTGKFLEDICTADGSILFLCQFLLTKI